MCSLSLYLFHPQTNTTYIHFPGSAYHSAAALHVVEVSVSMGTEVQTSSDPREGTALLEPQTTVWCPVFMLDLCPGTTGGKFDI